MKSKIILLFFMIGWFICFHLNGTNDSLSKMKFDSLRVKAQKLINTPEEILYLDSMLQLAQAIDSVHCKPYLLWHEIITIGYILTV